MIQPDVGLLNSILQDEDPCLRLQARRAILGEDPSSAEGAELYEEVRGSPRVQLLLSERLEDGSLPFHAYFKWRGAHWVLAQLASLVYPPGDASLIPLREQVLTWLLGKAHFKQIKTIDGRVRRCASQESNALLSLLRLGLADERCTELAQRLVSWQWPDGGWNCDRHPEASHSSFHESWLPMRALWAYSTYTGDTDAGAAAQRTAEHFLERRLFRRQSDGEIIDQSFIELHFPSYWHCDLLSALGGMAELGLLGDPRCQEALDLLESYWLPEGGFPAHGKYYHLKRDQVSGTSLVAWGPANRSKMNPWVTCTALGILRQAERWSPQLKTSKPHR